MSNNPLKQRFIKALATLVDSYGLTTTEINRRTGIDLGVIRRARAGRPANVTIEDVKAAELLINKLKSPVEDPQPATQEKVKELEARIEKMESRPEFMPPELFMTDEQVQQILLKQNEMIKKLTEEFEALRNDLKKKES